MITHSLSLVIYGLLGLLRKACGRGSGCWYKEDELKIGSIRTFLAKYVEASLEFTLILRSRYVSTYDYSLAQRFSFSFFVGLYMDMEHKGEDLDRSLYFFSEFVLANH